MQNIVFVLLLLVGGFGSWEMLFGPAVDVVRARSWERSPCRIVSSEVASSEPTGPPRTYRDQVRLLHSLEIDFVYEVGARGYRSRQYSFAPNVRTSGSRINSRIASRYTSGSDASCWVNPKDPSEAVINRRFQGTMLLGLAPFALFLFGLLALLDPLFVRSGARPRQLLPRRPSGEDGAARRSLGEHFENGRIAAIGFAGLALFGFLSAIGSEVSNLPFLAVHFFVAALLAVGYHFRSFAAAAGLAGYAFLLLLAALATIVAPGGRSFLPVAVLAHLGLADSPVVLRLSDLPAFAGEYAAEVAGWLLIPLAVAVLVALGARRLYLDRPKRPVGQLRLLAVVVALPAILILDPVVRSGVALAGRIGPARTIEEMVADLDGAKTSRIGKNCQAVGELRELPAEVVPALVRAVERFTGPERTNCIFALQGAGANGKPAERLLVATLQDPDPGVRHAAASVLGQLAPHLEASRVVPALVPLASGPVQYIRSAAAYSLGQFGPAAVSTVPVLRSLLADPDPLVRSSAAWALGQIGPGAAPATPDLVRLLGDPQADIRDRAVAALEAIGPGAAPAR